jgi:hypothetical protein
MDRSQLTQSKNPTSPTVSVRIHRRGNKNVDITFSEHERFWNNLHQVAQNQKIGKPNNLIILGGQNLWVLMIKGAFMLVVFLSV